MSLAFWSNVSLCLTTVLTNLLIFRFYAKIYRIKIKSKYMVVILFVIATSIHLLVNRTVLHSDIPNFFNTVYGIIHINIWSIILCNGKLKRKALFNTVYFLIIFLAEYIATVLVTIIGSLSLQSVLTNDKDIIISCALNALLMFLACNIYIYFLSRKELTKIKITQMLLLLLLTVFEIFVVYTYAFKISSYIDGIIAIVIVVGFIAFDFAITYIIEMMANFYEDKMELQLIRTQSELQLAHYLETDKKYQESQKVIHDIKKHLYTLRQLSGINSEKAESYCRLIEEGMDSLVVGFHCKNQILSIVMSQKIAVAENENVKVTTEIEDLELDFISDVDITAIFANLWDNAIAACRKVDSKDRFINVIIGQQNGFIVIGFENSYNGIVKKEDNKIKSVKEDHTGWGLSILNTTVKKYDGTFFTDYDENVFKTRLMIPASNK